MVGWVFRGRVDVGWYPENPENLAHPDSDKGVAEDIFFTSH